uniref:Uncharacterized protein n=1 Tax=Rhizophora mucronata TaxID=61149 RepID=A0A2P2JIS7_RHIMU
MCLHPQIILLVQIVDLKNHLLLLKGSPASTDESLDVELVLYDRWSHSIQLKHQEV